MIKKTDDQVDLSKEIQEIEQQNHENKKFLEQLGD